MTEDEMMSEKLIPEDTKLVVEEKLTVADYDAADTRGRALRGKILDDSRGRTAYDTATTEIERHQASLAQIRKARSLAQATLAETMGMDQSEVSRLEHRTDVLLSTLRRFIEATGGELQIVAHYPDVDFELLVGDALFSEPSDRMTAVA
jgi:DNA-binding transcriptional regulator YiaG